MIRDSATACNTLGETRRCAHALARDAGSSVNTVTLLTAPLRWTRWHFDCPVPPSSAPRPNSRPYAVRRVVLGVCALLTRARPADARAPTCNYSRAQRVPRQPRSPCPSPCSKACDRLARPPIMSPPLSAASGAHTPPLQWFGRNGRVVTPRVVTGASLRAPVSPDDRPNGMDGGTGTLAEWAAPTLPTSTANRLLPGSRCASCRAALRGSTPESQQEDHTRAHIRDHTHG